MWCSVLLHLCGVQFLPSKEIVLPITVPHYTSSTTCVLFLQLILPMLVWVFVVESISVSVLVGLGKKTLPFPRRNRRT